MEQLDAKEIITRFSKILIVDDSVFSREVLHAYSYSSGFENVKAACNGQEALEIIRTWKPDLLLLDMMMPVMDGMQLCQELQRLDLFSDIVVIMQTTVEDSDFKARAFDGGVTDFFLKPFSLREFTSRTKAHLERQYYRRKISSDYTRIRAELNEAAAMQQVLLPQQELIAELHYGAGLDIAYSYNPATELAGDYISVRKLDNNKIALLSGDVSGHGITAALLTFSIHTLLEDRILEHNTPGEVLAVLNKKLHDIVPRGRFATMFLGVIDLDNNQLCYAASAAPPPILIAQGMPHLLETRGFLLGAEGNSEYSTRFSPFMKGDTLVLYSDALIETAATNGDFMAEADIVQTALTYNGGDAKTLLKAIETSYHQDYAAQQTDDLSLLICKRS